MTFRQVISRLFCFNEALVHHSDSKVLQVIHLEPITNGVRFFDEK